MNYQITPTHRLMRRVAILNIIKDRGYICGMPLTQQGLDWLNAELSAIDAELDSRQSAEEFVTLLGEDGQPVGFEPENYIKAESAIEELSEDSPWDRYGFTVGSFL